MPTSAARPDDLEHFSAGSRVADHELLDSALQLRAAYAAFVSGCKWGKLDARSLLNGLHPKTLATNEEDARWVDAIAAAFRRAGGGERIARLPDAAIAASLRSARLGDQRQSPTFDDPVAFGAPPTTGYADDPVNTATGNFVEVDTDLPFDGLLAGLRFARTYNSRSNRVGPFGTGWSSWATSRLRAGAQGAEYEGPDGQRARFPRMGAGYGRVIGVHAVVEPLDAGLMLSWFGGGRWVFDEAGLPVRVERGSGSDVCLHHDGDGWLVGLTHQNGKRIDLEWHDERMVAAHSSDGRRVLYRYDSEGELVEVERPGGARRYSIDDDGRILSVADADGVLETRNTYDDDGRVVEQQSPFGHRTRFAYLPGRVTVSSDDDDGPASVYIHDDAGRVLEIIDGDEQRMAFNYDAWGNPVVITERSGAATVQSWDDRARLVRRVLPTGAEQTFVYDDADRAVEVVASGLVTRLRYSGDERSPVEIVDPGGGVSRMVVEDGLVREIVDPDGVPLRFEFDDDGAIVAIVDADGNVARLERDGAGRVTATVTPLGRRATFVYDDGGLLAERRDPAGGVWRYEHTPAGRLARMTDPTGARHEMHYGDHGSRSATVDPLGHVTTQHHDAFGNVIGVTAPDGAQWAYGYDALMRLTTIEDPAGARWRREYDIDGNLVARTDPVGVRQAATVDVAGRVTALSDGLTSSTFERDELGQGVAHVRADGTEVRVEYDLCGRTVSIRDPLGAITRIAYSPGGRVIRRVWPGGRFDEYAYDRCGRLAASIDGAGRRWEYRYDADGALVERIWPTGEVTRFGYDDAGRLVEASEPGRGVTRHDYDAVGRLSAITDRVAGARRFNYDAAGRLVAATDANGGVTRHVYDECGRVIRTVDALGATTTCGYDAVGRLVNETDALGRETVQTYDAAGRLIERTDASGRTTWWTYDGAGRTSGFGAADAGPIGIERDALGRVIAIVEPGAATIRLGWDLAGRLVERSRGELTMRWRYTADGERAALGYPDGTQTTYSYDAGGYVTGKHHPALGTIALERDAAGRLVGATADEVRARWRYRDGDLVEYEFDAAGRRRTTRLNHDAVGRVIAATVDGHEERFSHDPAGQLLSAEMPDDRFSFSYDANGRLTRETSRSGGVEYEYDAAGQLLVRRGAGSQTRTYEFDGAGRRVVETGADVRRTWRWDGLGRLAEIRTRRSRASDDSAEALTRVAVDAVGELAMVNDRQLLWDSAAAFSPLTWVDGRAVIGHGAPWALACDGAAEWLVPDWQGTVGELERDPLGAVRRTTGTAVGLQLGYRGELEFDDEVWLRNRTYEPSSRSFLQPDPLPAPPGTAWFPRTYQYAANDAVGLSDPLGLRPITDAELQAHRDRMNRNNGREISAGLYRLDRRITWGNPITRWTKRLDESDHPLADYASYAIKSHRAPISTSLGIGIGVAGLVTGQVERITIKDGTLVFEWDADDKSFSALALGGTVNVFSGKPEGTNFEHETEHSYQYTGWGDAFLPAYAATGVWGVISSKLAGNPQSSCFFGVDNEDGTYGQPLEKRAEQIDESDNCQ